MRNALLAGNIPVLLVALSALGACNSDYRSKVELPEDCDRQWFYEDQDGDGWGRPGGNAELLCTADTTDGVLLTARNDLDCDDGEDASSDAELDAAADVTGRVAAICPDELVLGGASTHAFQAAGSEFAAVMPTLDYGHVGQTDPDVTELVSATGAEAACGANGWGGELATFASNDPPGDGEPVENIPPRNTPLKNTFKTQPRMDAGLEPSRSKRPLGT